jgi:hypothetical protein
MALPGGFRGGRIFLAFNEAEIFEKTSVLFIKIRGGRSPVSGFAFRGQEEGDGAQGPGC